LKNLKFLRILAKIVAPPGPNNLVYNFTMTRTVSNYVSFSKNRVKLRENYGSMNGETAKLYFVKVEQWFLTFFTAGIP